MRVRVRVRVDVCHCFIYDHHRFFFLGGGGEQELFDGVATLLIKAAKALQVRMGVRAPDQDKDDENAMNESAGQHPEAPFRG